MAYWKTDMYGAVWLWESITRRICLQTWERHKKNAGETFFGATRDNLKNTSGFAKSYTSSGFISSKVNLSDSGDSNAGSDKKVAHTSSIGNSCAVDGLATKSMYEPVTSLPQNPCNAESQQAVLEKIGELAKLPFFVPPYEVKRQWVELTADLGACKTLFEKFEDKDDKFSACQLDINTCLI